MSASALMTAVRRMESSQMSVLLLPCRVTLKL